MRRKKCCEKWKRCAINTTRRKSGLKRGKTSTSMWLACPKMSLTKNWLITFVSAAQLNSIATREKKVSKFIWMKMASRRVTRESALRKKRVSHLRLKWWTTRSSVRITRSSSLKLSSSKRVKNTFLAKFKRQISWLKYKWRTSKRNSLRSASTTSCLMTMSRSWAKWMPKKKILDLKLSL